jgi:Tfp pilus assembly protein PilF
MLREHFGFSVCLAAALLCPIQPAAADTYAIILHGKVVLEGGGAPPFTVAIERICSDNSGSEPGPITNKKGEFIWRMEIDPLETRNCVIRATHAGYSSSDVEVSGLDTTRTTLTLRPIIIGASTADPYAINVSDSRIPGRARSEWNAAMKALDAPDLAAAANHLEAAVAKAPKFAQAWHGLGVVDERLKKQAEARTAYEHAIESDPKMLPPYVTLARLCIKTKDWDGAAKTSEALLKADPKHSYSEIYLHQAVALYELKDLKGAEESVQEAIRLDPKHKRPREEYVLGRILEAKGDAAGAQEHMAKYLQLDPAPADVDLVRGHLDNLGKPQAADIDPALEPL